MTATNQTGRGAGPADAAAAVAPATRPGTTTAARSTGATCKTGWGQRCPTPLRTATWPTGQWVHAEEKKVETRRTTKAASGPETPTRRSGSLPTKMATVRKSGSPPPKIAHTRTNEATSASHNTANPPVTVNDHKTAALSTKGDKQQEITSRGETAKIPANPQQTPVGDRELTARNFPASGRRDRRATASDRGRSSSPGTTQRLFLDPGSNGFDGISQFLLPDSLRDPPRRRGVPLVRG